MWDNFEIAISGVDCIYHIFTDRVMSAFKWYTSTFINLRISGIKYIGLNVFISIFYNMYHI